MVASEHWQSAKRSFPTGLKVWLTIVALLALSKRVEAITMIVDPGAVGSSSSYISGLFFNSINGSVFNGQTESWNFIFANNKFAVAGSVGVDLDINQSGALGTLPSSWFTVTAYLIDALGNPVSSQINLGDMGEMPAQIWPGWPYHLPDGTQYLPETTMYESQFPSTVINSNYSGYYLQPIIFSGIHFDVTFPDDPTETALGGQLNFSGDPIYISPSSTPQFFVNGVPESTSTLLLLSLGLMGLAGLRSKLQK